MSKQNKMIVGVIVILAVLIGGYLLWSSKTSAPATPAANTNSEAAANVPTAGEKVHSGLTYTQAAAKYGAGLRFQFNNCNGNPGSLAMKTGTAFMLDNRDKDAHTFALGGVTYPIAGNDFAIVTAGKVGTYNITCDKGGGAQVIVQK